MIPALHASKNDTFEKLAHVIKCKAQICFLIWYVLNKNGNVCIHLCCTERNEGITRKKTETKNGRQENKHNTLLTVK
jgi:hypothetical protein